MTRYGIQHLSSLWVYCEKPYLFSLVMKHFKTYELAYRFPSITSVFTNYFMSLKVWQLKELNTFLHNAINRYIQLSVWIILFVDVSSCCNIQEDEGKCEFFYYWTGTEIPLFQECKRQRNQEKIVKILQKTTELNICWVYIKLIKNNLEAFLTVVFLIKKYNY